MLDVTNVPIKPSRPSAACATSCDAFYAAQLLSVSYLLLCQDGFHNCFAAGEGHIVGGDLFSKVDLLPTNGHIYLALIEAKGFAHRIERGDAGEQVTAHSRFGYVFGRLSVRRGSSVLDDQLKHLFGCAGLVVNQLDQESAKGPLGHALLRCPLGK
ncbi:hypothetical protein D3C72_1687940 [compost metagenome]